MHLIESEMGTVQKLEYTLSVAKFPFVVDIGPNYFKPDSQGWIMAGDSVISNVKCMWELGNTCVCSFRGWMLWNWIEN